MRKKGLIQRLKASISCVSFASGTHSCEYSKEMEKICFGHDWMSLPLFFHPFICIFHSIHLNFHFIYLPISQKNSTFASAFIYKVGNDFTITTKA